MKGDREIIQHLNKVLSNQLTAINQYFLHSRMANDWGLVDLGEKDYKASIREMKAADKVIERILFLEGLPNLQGLNKLFIGENTEEVIKCDLELELLCLVVLRETIVLCEDKKDYVTREILQGVLEQQEEHVDWLETQLALIGNIGIQNYIQSQV